MNLPDGLYAPPIAHRGLWRPGEAVENSLSAFEKACQAGYGIELDVRVTADGEAVVFHDDDLERLTGAQGSVWGETAETLTSLPLRGGPDRIPTLAQTLELVAGRAMLLIELKAVPDHDGQLEARVAQLLERYRGPAAVISFEPEALAWFALHQPHLPRGLDAMGLSDQDAADHPDDLPGRFARYLAVTQPHFLVLEQDSVSGALAQGERRRGLPVVAWTVRSAEEAAQVGESCENFIFEGFTA